MSTEEKLTPVTKSHPCKVCGGDHKCSRGSGGLLVCGRAAGDVPGFFHIGASKQDPQWHLYRVEQDKPQPRRNRSSIDWEAVAGEHAARIKEPGRRALAAALGLPVAVLDLFTGLGANKDDSGPHWTFPERDGRGRVVGINRRYTNGAKKVMPGGHRGLTIITGWRERPGPVLIPEGASDTLALTAAGIAAVGRPTNTGGVDHLAALLADWPTDRSIVVLGENDQKPDGKWPGKEGVESVAPKLAERLGRTVLTSFPPDGAKDVRAWFAERVKAGAA